MRYEWDFHYEYLVNRDMAGSDLVYIKRYKHNTAEIFVICIEDTFHIVMQFKQTLSLVDEVVFYDFMILWL